MPRHRLLAMLEVLMVLNGVNWEVCPLRRTGQAYISGIASKQSIQAVHSGDKIAEKSLIIHL